MAISHRHRVIEGVCWRKSKFRTAILFTHDFSGDRFVVNLIRSPLSHADPYLCPAEIYINEFEEWLPYFPVPLAIHERKIGYHVRDPYMFIVYLYDRYI